VRHILDTDFVFGLVALRVAAGPEDVSVSPAQSQLAHAAVE